MSVVIPAYNAAQHIAATVESVLAQEKVALELIIVDDCSTDGTAVYLEAVVARDPRVRYMRMPANSGGPAGPRNFGANRARAQWVALCDADDLWHPLKLRYQLDLAARTGADLVCCAIEDVQDGKVATLLDRTLPAAITAKPLRYWQMIIKNRIATSSVLCRRRDICDGGGFDTARELVAVEDYDLWLRLLERPGFRGLRIADPLVAYRRLPGSLSASKWLMARKALRTTRRAANRRGWSWAYPFVAPFLFVGYASLSVYWRVFKGRL